MTYHAKCDHADGCNNMSGPVFDNELLPTADDSPGWVLTASPIPPHEDLWYCPAHADEGRRVNTFLKALRRKTFP